MSSGLEDFSLFDLFRMEAEEQVATLQAQLLKLEDGQDAKLLESLMRAAHSLKGAARIVGLDTVVHLTHAMEDRLVGAQAGRLLETGDLDRLLAATDWLARLQVVPEVETADWLARNTPAIEALTAEFSGQAAEPEPVAEAQPIVDAPPEVPAKPPPAPLLREESEAEERDEDIFAQRGVEAPRGGRERHVRINARRFDEILALASEGLVSSRRLAADSEVLERQRRSVNRALLALEDEGSIPEAEREASRAAALRELRRQITAVDNYVAELGFVARGHERSSERLYRTVLAGRLRPFADGITGVGRLVRETARDLGKQVRLEVLGEQTRVDRDILERLEAPIAHLVNNAIDHGIEPLAVRLAAGKPAEARLTLQSRHENGRLVITLRDDGGGIHRDALRERIVRRGLVAASTAEGLSDAELLEFLFLPGFSTRDAVSSVSGRGVGLNVVQSMVQEAGGSVTVQSEPGVGTVFRLTLPVTRSVMKVIRVQAEGESYAAPLVRIDRLAHLEARLAADGKTHEVEVDGRTLQVVSLGTLLGLATRPIPAGSLPLLLCGPVAFAVDRFQDEVELPVRRLDARLGTVPGVSAASLDENGLPLLILDIDGLVLTATGALQGSADVLKPGEPGQLGVPHILVVDDSHTVREMERRLLVRAGYEVTTAQNGQEAWNLLRLSEYDLLISDVDMPQMNGIELVTRVRDNPRLQRMAVILLSYKDREEDRQRGLDAGADFYLTKGDFQNDRFRQTVEDVVGPGHHGAKGAG
jgi:two-component system sensor histidine kinase and response regulator WspE